jgi:nondiscriminating glutamyl-tRNA synthetase
MNHVRVRFAPSPTGHLHIGGVRTALFNWLFARQHQGVFILRIEDTDMERSTEESTRTILESLKWLGLDWDEGPVCGGPVGPYFQSQRTETYRKTADDLIRSGQAYYCFCSVAEVEAQRQTAREEHQIPRYQGVCREMSQEEQEAALAAGKPYVIRFRVPEGETVLDDIIRGRTVFKNETLEDFVIIKSDGVGTYNFAVVVDDHLMDITHVIRGDDHIANTPRQILLYQALGWDVPEFAHLPMILGPDKTRLSKRHGAVSAMQYWTDGFLPDALLNYLALLGWSYDGKQQIFSVAEMIEKFSLAKVSKNPAVFDPDKLVWMNAQYIKNMPDAEFTRRGLPYLLEAGVLSEPLTCEQTALWEQAAPLVKERVRQLDQIGSMVDYFFRDDIEISTAAREKSLTGAGVKELLQAYRQALAEFAPYDTESLETMLRAFCADRDIKAGALVQPLRAVLTGRTVSPGIFDVMVLLGKERALRRIDRAIDRM